MKPDYMDAAEELANRNVSLCRALKFGFVTWGREGEKTLIFVVCYLFDSMDTSQAPGVLAAVDCTKQKSLAKKFEIGGFPTRKYSLQMTQRVRR